MKRGDTTSITDWKASSPSTTSADSWQNVSVDNQDDKEQKKTDTIPDEESQYAFEDAVSLPDQDIVHVTGNEE